MEDYKLKVFCTVAEVKSFSRASEIIHLTQPAVSAQIQVLEDYYGTKLFDRTTNNVTLTATGEILYKYAREILSLYAETEKSICRLTGLLKGSIKVGASTTVGNYLMPKIIIDFLKENSDKVKINLRVGSTKKISDLLNSSNIDLGIVEGDIKSQKITVDKFLEDELHLIVSPNHGWSNKEEIDVASLQEEPIILREEGSGSRQLIEKLFVKYGLSIQNMKVFLMLESIEAIKEAVKRDIGVAFESRIAIKKELQDGSLKAINVKGERITRAFSIIYRKKGFCYHLVDEFVAFIKGYDFNTFLFNNNDVLPT
ncbi:MAG: LysR family transcriptional regulator [Candidatus Magnetoovum sp. WYHC-5]|nr:LysR family transcriptional regulator [Candidatus Magnetoovum sp. WYHC-5]